MTGNTIGNGHDFTEEYAHKAREVAHVLRGDPGCAARTSALRGQPGLPHGFEAHDAFCRDELARKGTVNLWDMNTPWLGRNARRSHRDEVTANLGPDPEGSHPGFDTDWR